VTIVMRSPPTRGSLRLGIHGNSRLSGARRRKMRVDDGREMPEVKSIRWNADIENNAPVLD